MKKNLLFYCFIIAAMISCSPKLSPDNDWGYKRWVLSDMKGVPVQQSGTRKDAYIEFSPNDKKFTGNAGCNRMSGNYTLDKKDKIEFGEVITTKMACADINFETVFLSTLSTVDKFKVDNGNLLLKDNGDVVLVFVPQTASR